jgi:hypothetical protein
MEEVVQLWCIWYIIRNFVIATVYPHPGQQLKKVAEAIDINSVSKFA